jgi:hypothetical protein
LAESAPADPAALGYAPLLCPSVVFLNNIHKVAAQEWLEVYALLEELGAPGQDEEDTPEPPVDSAFLPEDTE